MSFCITECCRLDKRVSLEMHDRSLAVMGVAHLRGKLYVVFLDSTDIAVYQTNITDTTRGVTGSCQKPTNVIKVKGILGAKDIVACSISECCYVPDSSGVWRVRFDDEIASAGDNDDGEMEKWTVKDAELWFKGSKVNAVSIAAGGNVLLTTATKLCLHSPAGKLIYAIPLVGDYLEGIQQAVDTTRETIIICQAILTEDRLYRISEINWKGELLQSYGGKCAKGDGPLIRPRYAVKDAERGRLFVSDVCSNRVVLFDDKLRLHGVLVKDEVEYYRRMCYVNELRLLLCCGVYGVVNVYRVFP